MNIIDLTLTYNQEIAGYTSEIEREVEKDGWNAKTLHIYSHAGTHMDSPFHFGVNKQTIEMYHPSRLMGKAWVVHIENVVPQQLLFPSDLGNIEKDFRPGDNLLLQTNWSKRLGTKDYRDGLPRISEELANWCVDKKVNILGVEPPSVADVNNLEEVTLIHHILLRGDIIIVEGLTNLDQLTQKEVFLMAFPLKIKDGDGAPARVMAMDGLPLLWALSRKATES